MKISEIINETYWSNIDRREQRAMDASKRDFKRAEMEHELGHEDRFERSRKSAALSPSTYYISINGSIWKKDGTPVQFNGASHANAVAAKIKARSPNKEIRITTSANERRATGDAAIIDEDAAYDAAERFKADAKIAKEAGDMGDFYALMADYHDAMVQWHESKGRYSAADREAAKVEQYNAAAKALFTKSDFE